MRHVFTYTPAFLSHKRKTCTNKFDFLLPPDPDGRFSVIYFFESFEVFIQSETTINCLKPGLKQGDMGSSYCSYQNQFMFYSRYVNIHTVEGINQCIFQAPSFFPGFIFLVTQICLSVDLVVNFSSLLLLS